MPSNILFHSKMKSAQILVTASVLHFPISVGSLQTSFVPLPRSHRDFDTPITTWNPPDCLSREWHRSKVFSHHKAIFQGRSRTERATWHHGVAYASRNSDEVPGAASVDDTSYNEHEPSSKRVGNKVKRSKGALADAERTADAISSRVRVRLKDLAAPATNAALKGSEQTHRDRLARAAASLIVQRKENEAKKNSLKSKRLSFSSMSAAKAARARRNNPSWAPSAEDSTPQASQGLIELMHKINHKILRNNWSRSGQRRGVNENKLYDGPNVHTQHATDSMQSLLGYNQFQGEWNDRNATTYHVAIVFGKPLIQDQVTVEYATRIRALVKIFKEETLFCPKLICFTGGVSQ
ncbi:hypothetical protein ACHAW6_013025 [Cyclotella cf. meneghiniana]